MADDAQRTSIENTLIEGGLSQPANWHNLTSIGGEVGQSLSKSLKYWFIDDNPDFSLNSGAQTAVNKALNLWKTYTGINFTLAESKDDAQITFAYDNFLLPGQVNYYGKAVTYPPDSLEVKEDVKVRFNLLKTDNKDNSWSENSFENINNNRYFRIIVHEIGHALGLTDRYTDNPFYTGMSKEVGDGIGQAGIYPGVSTDYMLPN